MNERAKALGGAAVGILSLGLLAGGCGGSSGGGGGGVGNAAIDATLGALRTSMLTQSANLDASVTNGAVANPLAAPTAGTSGTVPLTGANHEGTATNVTATLAVNANATNGSGSMNLQVTEDATSFAFIDATVSWNSPSISFRAAPNGYAALAAAGTGQAFIIASITQSGSVTVSFTNDSGTATLVDFTGPPDLSGSARADGTRSGTYTRVTEVLIEYSITGTGTLTARIERTETVGSRYIFTRSGGPATSQLSQSIANLVIGALTGLNGNGDVTVPVGTDLGVTPSAGASDAISFALSLTGGVVGGDLDTDITGAVTAPLTNANTTSVNFNDTLAASAAQVGNGNVEIDESVVVSSSSEEDPTAGGSLTHALDAPIAALGAGFGSLEELLYLPSESSSTREFPLYR
ncbi:MAG: hypothetical protein D6731_04170 [Planctomycetota bacterium]|nr:MAG: hypothetical protein D6731_04170 [Planctomycetota bacterium]